MSKVSVDIQSNVPGKPNRFVINGKEYGSGITYLCIEFIGGENTKYVVGHWNPMNLGNSISRSFFVLISKLQYKFFFAKKAAKESRSHGK